MTDPCSEPTGVHRHRTDGEHHHGVGTEVLGTLRPEEAHHHHDSRCIAMFVRLIPYVRHTQICKARHKDDDRCDCGLKELRDG